MATVTDLSSLVLNLLTQEQYNSAVKNANELYLINNVDNSEIFIATYGTTTFEEITTALAENKLCLCKNAELIGYLKSSNSNMHKFESINPENDLGKTIMMVSSNNAWVNAPIMVASTISSDSTEIEYATAKAVYDFLESAMGTILNGAS